MVTQKAISLARCDGFVDLQIWPQSHTLNPRGWLSNFLPDELPYALSLLDNFIYYSEPLVDRMFEEAFTGLLSRLLWSGQSITAVRQVLDRTCFTFVTGETPRVTDSGHIFARKVRQVLGISEHQILYPQDAIKHICLTNFDSVVFVDDFIGSGSQFIATWTRSYMDNLSVSFESISSIQASYIPLVATNHGIKTLRGVFPNVNFYPTNVVPDNMSALDQNSIIWPPDQKANAINFIKKASNRAGCSWDGFNDQGYLLAFYHSVPDATLPIFWHDRNGWIPLIRRT